MKNRVPFVELKCWLAGCLLALSVVPRLAAQDALYLRDQTIVKGALAEINDQKVVIRVPKGDNTLKRSYKPESVVLILNQLGHWLCGTELLALSPEARAARLDAFLSGDAVTSVYDVILKRNPVGVATGTISYESNEVINFRTPTGGEASINKADVTAVFRRTGVHSIEAADASKVCEEAEAIRVALASTAPAVSRNPGGTRPAGGNQPSGSTRAPKSDPAPANPPARSEPTSTPAASGKTLTLSEEEYQRNSDRALRKVEEFSSYLSVIVDKSLDAETKNKAIDQACSLFKPGASIQVSSTSRGGAANSYRIREYLIRLKLLSYSQVNLTWSNVQFVENLTQRADGKYYGMIRGEQRFEGFGRNGKLKYGDVTEKNVEVMLQSYQKRVEGEVKNRWDILLGDVGVVATR